jgi:hypothetical protein
MFCSCGNGIWGDVSQIASDEKGEMSFNSLSRNLLIPIFVPVAVDKDVLDKNRDKNDTSTDGLRHLMVNTVPGSGNT